MEASVQEDRKVDWSVLDADAAYLILIKKPRGELKHLIYELQPELWKIERALNVPINESLMLEKGWALKTAHELAEIAAIILPSLERAKRELEEMESAYGKADEIRKEIEGCHRVYVELCRKVNVYPTFVFPKGFRYMNPSQLQPMLMNSREAVEHARKRVVERGAEAEREKREAEIRREHRERVLEEERKHHTLMTARRSRLDEVFTEYEAQIKRIKDHPVLGRAIASTPRFTLGHRDLHLFAFSTEEENQKRVLAAKNECAAALRKLREPMRRAWQSAYDRREVRVEFKAYLEQEGVTLP